MCTWVQNLPTMDGMSDLQRLENPSVENEQLMDKKPFNSYENRSFRWLLITLPLPLTENFLIIKIKWVSQFISSLDGNHLKVNWSCGFSKSSGTTSRDHRSHLTKLTQGKNWHIYPNFLEPILNILDFQQSGMIKITRTVQALSLILA